MNFQIIQKFGFKLWDAESHSQERKKRVNGEK